MDLSMGFMFGLYVPIQKRWRYKDCRSRWLHSALNLTGYAKHFDKPFKGGFAGWANLALQVAFTADSFYATASTCAEQYGNWNDSSDADYNWPYDFNILQTFAIDEEP